MATGTGHRLESIAQDFVEVLTRLSLHTQARHRRGVELKEVEYLTLAILQSHQPLIVGEIQRILAVLPAQMSRIIRSLEDRPQPLIRCQINPQDKRKVDVRLTAPGLRALEEYQESRVQRLMSLLASASEEEQDELERLAQRIAGVLERAGYSSEV